MTSSCSKWVILSLALIAPSLAAQVPLPTPAPTPEPKVKEGYMRLWNILPKDAGELVLQHGPEAEPTVVAAADPANFAAGYVPVKPGRYLLRAALASNPKTTLKTFDIIMREGVYVSFIAQVKDGAFSLEMVDETYSRKDAITGRLTLRQFLPGAKVSISAPGVSNVGPISPGGVEVIENIPLRPVVFRLRAAQENGEVHDWNLEVDFRSCRRASIFLALDPYGRFRPRISPEGQIGFTDPEAVP